MLDGKVDLIHVSTGGGHPSGGTVMHPSMFLPHGCNVYLAAEIKKHVSTPVATVGSLSEPDKMEQIIASGQADLVCMARPLIADPYLPQKVMEGRAGGHPGPASVATTARGGCSSPGTCAARWTRSSAMSCAARSPCR